MSKKNINTQNKTNISTEDVNETDLSTNESDEKSSTTDTIQNSEEEIVQLDNIDVTIVSKDKPNLYDFMGNGNDVFSTYKQKYENTISSAYILLFFGIVGVIFTIIFTSGLINAAISTFQYIFLSTLYILFIVYGIISYRKAMEYKSLIKTETSHESEILSYLENNITQEYLDHLNDNSLTDEENYILYIDKIRNSILEQHTDFDAKLVEYHIDSYLNEHF